MKIKHKKSQRKRKGINKLLRHEAKLEQAPKKKRKGRNEESSQKR